MQLGDAVSSMTIQPAFSILGRIGGDATRSLSSFKEGRRTLSVSSVGSEAMQRVVRIQNKMQRAFFQYPRSDRRRCNVEERTRWCLDPRPSFSILGRIGGDATPPPPTPTPMLDAYFQYPRSDRRRCNSLTVTSRAFRSTATFSILGRIGGDATRGRCGPHSVPFPLSVSSVGSEAMQLFLGPGWTGNRQGCTFSILGRIGGDATLGFPAARTWSVYFLSVSSVGSEAMQPTLNC